MVEEPPISDTVLLPTNIQYIPICFAGVHTLTHCTASPPRDQDEVQPPYSPLSGQEHPKDVIEPTEHATIKSAKHRAIGAMDRGRLQSSNRSSGLGTCLSTSRDRSGGLS